MLSLYQQLDTLIYHTNKLLKQYIFIQSNSHPTLYNRRLVEIFSYLEVNCNAFFSLLVRIGICFHNIFRYSKVEMDWHIQRIIGLKLTVQNLMATPLLGAVRLSKFNIFYHNAFQSLHDIQRREIDFIHYPDLEVIISDLIGKFESTDFEDSSVVAFLQIFLTKLWVLLYRGLKKLQILIIHRTENDKIQSIISLLRLLYRVETLLRSDCVPFTVSELN